MTAAPASLSATSRPTSRSVARVVGRPALRSGAVWGLVFGLYAAVVAKSFASTYPTAASRRVLVQEFGSNAGIDALVGPAVRIATVSGFTAWKCLTTFVIVGAVWGLLLATKLTRGEEESGRWELLLAGPITRAGALRQAMHGLAAGVGAMFVATALVLGAAGQSSSIGISVGAASYFALAAVAGAAMFASLGVLTAQVSATRRQAAGLAAAVLGASYALRMVADATTGLAALRWASPLGWIENLAPLTRPSPGALLPVAAWCALCLGAALALAARRDLHASVLADHDDAPSRVGLLAGTLALATRLQRWPVIAWCAAVVVYGLLLGSIAKAGGQIITSSPSMARVFARLGVSGAEAFLGVALLIMAVVLNFVVASQLSAMRAEESSGRLDSLVVQPLSRTRWFLERVAFAAGVVVVVGMLAGLGTWVGETGDHAGVGLGTMVNAGLNVIAPSLLLVGLGAFLFGAVPRVCVGVMYAVVAWWFLVEIVAGVVRVDHWILDTSALHQMAAAPSVPVDWGTDLVMVGLAALGVVLGAVAFSRRDLVGE